MDNINQRVARCFSNVFPNLGQDQIPAASAMSLAAWDSLAQVRLMSSIEEEFGLQLEMEAFEELVSHQLIVAHLEKISANA